jgi:hypothetical protein
MYGVIAPIDTKVLLLRIHMMEIVDFHISRSHPTIRTSTTKVLNSFPLVSLATLHQALYIITILPTAFLWNGIVQARQEASAGKSGRKGSPSWAPLEAGLGESISISVAITSTAVRPIPSLSVYLRCEMRLRCRLYADSVRRSRQAGARRRY